MKNLTRKYVSYMLNVLLASFLVVSLTYGGAFGNKVSLGLSGYIASDYLVIMYSGGKVGNFWVVKDGIVQKDRTSNTTMWEIDGNVYEATGSIIVMDLAGDADYDMLKERYTLTNDDIKFIKDALE